MQCMHNLKYTLKILLFAIAFGHAVPAAAQYSGGSLGVDLDAKTLSVQAKAEELFSRGDFSRAHVIYLNDLAPIGDKYAQYMLGFMSLTGRGVEPDAVLASAWFRLAAERGKPPEFVKIRDELLLQLDAGDRSRSDTVFVQLWREYSDSAIRLREVREAFEEISGITTGSRLGTSSSSAVTILEPRAGSSLSGDALKYRLQRHMQDHLDHITSDLGIGYIDAETVDRGQLADLEDRMEEYVQRLNAP